MRYIYMRKRTPEINKIERLTQKGTEAADSPGPTTPTRQRRIDSYEDCFGVGIVAPMAKE